MPVKDCAATKQSHSQTMATRHAVENGEKQQVARIATKINNFNKLYQIHA